MATTYIHGLGKLPERGVSYSIRHFINYAVNPEKTRGGELVRYVNCSPDNAAAEMLLLQKEAQASTGRSVLDARSGEKANIMLEIRQSFEPGEVDADTALSLGCELADILLGKEYQYVVAAHINTDSIHTHIRFNAIGDDGRKFHLQKYSFLQVRAISDMICERHDLSVVIPSKGRSSRLYSKAPIRIPWRTFVKNDIDRCISQSADFDVFLLKMKEEYFVKTSGKHMTFRHKTNGQQRPVRSYTLGNDYTEKALRERIDGLSTAHPPEKLATYSAKLRKIQEGFSMVDALRDGGIHSFEELQDKLQELYAAAQMLKIRMGAGETEEIAPELLQEYVAVQEEISKLNDAQRKLGVAPVVQDEKGAR